MEEVSFYQSTDVTVTQSRYIVGSKTFAMRNISSVQIGFIPVNRNLGYVMTVLGFVLLFSEQVRTYGVVILLVGVALAYYPKDRFTVRISTNAGESDSLVSKDKQFIQKIVKACKIGCFHGLMVWCNRYYI